MNDQGHLVTRVYGLNVNPERAGLVRKVLGISTAMAVLEFINFIYSTIINEDVSMVWGVWPLIFGLMIPACGYFGAKNSSKELIAWFVGCSGCVAVALIISLARLYDVYSDASDADRENMTHAVVVASVLSIPTLLLAIAGVCYGSELQSKREHIIVRSNNPAPRLQQVPQVTINVQQPGMYGHQMPQPGYPPAPPNHYAQQQVGYPPPQQQQYVQQVGYPPPHQQQYAQQAGYPPHQQQVPQYSQATAPPQMAYAQAVPATAVAGQDKSNFT
ncbi:hypothetical protein TrRE_jg5673 [Triparma retinervis]|uniref:Uncharacterized protein n=1 Tax=Triparma retinervis TaxID=2557542 RepID=A0A9W7CA84_9STRA|nr:hypothetical protein TrRE_jg5673 [Triparma retinervis]